jgi:very-short-patch-repair endonuclease
MSWGSSVGRSLSRRIYREAAKAARRKATYRRVQKEAAQRPESRHVETPTGAYWMSPIEQKLYEALRSEGLSPVPQFPVEGYIVDFAFPEFKLAIEADGAAFHDGDLRERDQKRDWILKYRYGWTVTRFRGTTIHNKAADCAYAVKREVEDRIKHREMHEEQRVLERKKQRDAILAPFKKVAALFRSQGHDENL